MTKPYMSLTVHFITENFELNTQCILVTTPCKAHERSASRRTGTTDDASNTIKVLELNGWI